PRASAQARQPLRVDDAARTRPRRAPSRPSRRRGPQMIDALLRPVTVLVYHGLGRPDEARLLITPARLEAQVRYLQRRGDTVVPAQAPTGRHPEGTVQLAL